MNIIFHLIFIFCYFNLIFGGHSIQKRSLFDNVITSKLTDVKNGFIKTIQDNEISKIHNDNVNYIKEKLRNTFGGSSGTGTFNQNGETILPRRSRSIRRIISPVIDDEIKPNDKFNNQNGFPTNDQNRIRPPINENQKRYPMNENQKRYLMNENQKRYPINENQKRYPMIENQYRFPINDQTRFIPNNQNQNRFPINEINKNRQPLNDKQNRSPNNANQNGFPQNENQKMNSMNQVQKRFGTVDDVKDMFLSAVNSPWLTPRPPPKYYPAVEEIPNTPPSPPKYYRGEEFPNTLNSKYQSGQFPPINPYLSFDKDRPNINSRYPNQNQQWNQNPQQDQYPSMNYQYPQQYYPQSNNMYNGFLPPQEQPESGLPIIPDDLKDLAPDSLKKLMGYFKIFFKKGNIKTETPNTLLPELTTSQQQILPNAIPNPTKNEQQITPNLHEKPYDIIPDIKNSNKHENMILNYSTSTPHNYNTNIPENMKLMDPTSTPHNFNTTIPENMKLIDPTSTEHNYNTNMPENVKLIDPTSTEYNHNNTTETPKQSDVLTKQNESIIIPHQNYTNMITSSSISLYPNSTQNPNDDIDSNSTLHTSIHPIENLNDSNKNNSNSFDILNNNHSTIQHLNHSNVSPTPNNASLSHNDTNEYLTTTEMNYNHNETDLDQNNTTWNTTIFDLQSNHSTTIESQNNNSTPIFDFIQTTENYNITSLNNTTEHIDHIKKFKIPDIDWNLSPTQQTMPNNSNTTLESPNSTSTSKFDSVQTTDNYNATLNHNHSIDFDLSPTEKHKPNETLFDVSNNHSYANSSTTPHSIISDKFHVLINHSDTEQVNSSITTLSPSSIDNRTDSNFTDNKDFNNYNHIGSTTPPSSSSIDKRTDFNFTDNKDLNNYNHIGSTTPPSSSSIDNRTDSNFTDNKDLNNYNHIGSTTPPSSSSIDNRTDFNFTNNNNLTDFKHVRKLRGLFNDGREPAEGNINESTPNSVEDINSNLNHSTNDLGTPNLHQHDDTDYNQSSIHHSKLNHNNHSNYNQKIHNMITTFPYDMVSNHSHQTMTPISENQSVSSLNHSQSPNVTIPNLNQTMDPTNSSSNQIMQSFNHTMVPTNSTQDPQISNLNDTMFPTNLTLNHTGQSFNHSSITTPNQILNQLNPHLNHNITSTTTESPDYFTIKFYKPIQNTPFPGSSVVPSPWFNNIKYPTPHGFNFFPLLGNYSSFIYNNFYFSVGNKK